MPDPKSASRRLRCRATVPAWNRVAGRVGDAMVLDSNHVAEQYRDAIGGSQRANVRVRSASRARSGGLFV